MSFNFPLTENIEGKENYRRKLIELAEKYGLGDVYYFSEPCLSGLMVGFNHLSYISDIEQTDEEDTASALERVEFHFEYEDNPAIATPLGYLYGLWGIINVSSSIYSEIQNRGFYSATKLNIHFVEADSSPPAMNYITAIPPVEDLYKNGLLEHPVDEIFKITPDDLLITRKQIEKIYSLTGRQVPSFISGEVTKEDVATNTDKTPHHRTLFAQRAKSEIVRAALYVIANNSDFKNKCINKDGSYNYSQWTELVTDSAYLFDNGTCPLTDKQTIAETIKNATTLPKN